MWGPMSCRIFWTWCSSTETLQLTRPWYKVSSVYHPPTVRLLSCQRAADIPEKYTMVLGLVNVALRSLADRSEQAKYTRCLFQLMLPQDSELVFQLVERILPLCETWPSAEVQWLATVTFNQAVDLYVQGFEEPCRRWAVTAMSVAKEVDDGGAMLRSLHDRFLKLRFAN